MLDISLPCYIEGERVVALFPIIGGTLDKPNFVEADVVTESRVGSTQAFVVRRVNLKGETLFAADAVTSFPAAIRLARKNAGWG